MSTDMLREPGPTTGRRVTWLPVVVLAALTVCAVTPHLGGVLQTGGVLSMVTMPLLPVCVLGTSLTAFVWGLPRRGVRRMSLAVAVGLLLVTVACAGVLAFDLSPMGTALAAWRMD